MSARPGFRPFRFPLGAHSVLLALVAAGCSDESLTQPATDRPSRPRRLAPPRGPGRPLGLRYRPGHPLG